MYGEEWVKDLVKKIQVYLQENKEWLGIDERKEQRVLDYACGHGTISLVSAHTATLAPASTDSCSQGLLESFPIATFQGIDLDSRQVARYNKEAENASTYRMKAIQGDLLNQSRELEKDEWCNFDLAIISMALHHVPDPHNMLVQLRKRLRPGGVLIIVEMLGATHHSHGNGYGHDHHSHEQHQTHAHGMNGHADQMVETIGGQQIWPGFSADGMRQGLVTAGFGKESVDVRIPGVTFDVPEAQAGQGLGGVKELMFIRAVAPGGKSSI